MFQFGGFPSYSYLFHCTICDSSSQVLPHSDIRGSLLICSSPQLFAACHVLRRLPMPRHSPYALLRLNYFCILISIYSVLVFLASESLCIILAVFFGRSVLLRPAKFVFLPFTEKPDFVLLLLNLVFSLYFVCHVCHTNSFELI